MQSRIISILIITFLLFSVSCNKGDSFSGPSSPGAGGSTARMTIAGNYLYIVSSTALFTFDISKPTETVLISQQPLGWGNIETIFPYKDKLFVGSQTGMFVFDNSDPKKPKLQGRADHFRACDPVVADDDYAYVTLRNNNRICGGTLNQLIIYNISGINILSPKVVSTLSMAQPNGLGSKENTLYVCMGNNGLNVVDITSRTNPKSLKVIQGEDFVDVIPYDNLLIAYVAGGVVLYDITDPTQPKKLSKIQN